MFLASLMFVAFALVSNNAQTIIESSAVIATSITALVMALRAGNKQQASRSPKRKPKTAPPARVRSGESLNGDTM